MLKKPFWTFFGLFIIVFSMTIFSLYCLIVYFKTPLSHDVLSNFGGLLEGTLGIAVGLAGAVIAIIIASQTYNIYSLQKKREDYIELSRMIESRSMPIIKFIKSYREFYWSYVRLEGEYLIKAHKGPRHWDESSADLEISRLQVAGCLTLLADSIVGITEVPESLELWTELVPKSKLKLELLTNDRLSVVKDLPEIANILYHAALRMKNTASTFSSAEFNTHRNIAKFTKDKNGEILDNNDGGVKTLLQAGAEIFINKIDDSNVENIGAAILNDLLISIPENNPEFYKFITNNFNFKISDKSVLSSVSVYNLLKKDGFRYWLGSSLATVHRSLEEKQPNFKVGAPNSESRYANKLH